MGWCKKIIVKKNVVKVQKLMKWCHFWIQKLLKNINICIQKLAKWTIFLLDPEIDEMLQFLDPEIVEKLQFLDPEFVEMDITYFWIQKLMKWCNFWIQKLLKWSPNPLWTPSCLMNKNPRQRQVRGARGRLMPVKGHILANIGIVFLLPYTWTIHLSIRSALVLF